MHIYRKCVFALFAIAVLPLQAQTSDDKGITVNGSVQSDVLIGQRDEAIGAEKPEEWMLTNTYADVNVQSKHLNAGARLAFNRYPLPGYERDFKGWGVPYYYLTGKLGKTELTLGSFYEQFGSGFVLRTYEERSLGIDSHIQGARIVSTPVNGVRMKALTGRQRRYWDYNDSWMSGADIELNFEAWSRRMREAGWVVSLGASVVNKFEKEEHDNILIDQAHRLRLPEKVNAYDVRLRVQRGAWNVLGEYAWKTHDPSFDNGYIYHHGSVAMLSASYSRRGLSLLAQAKRSDDMQWRSRRSMTGISSMINHLPAFTQDQTYSLAAMYPYATQGSGEWAYQLQAGYRLKPKTTLGGRYGTFLKVNFSYVTGLDKRPHSLKGYTTPMGSDGYAASFWGHSGEKYYQDINLQAERRITKDFRLNLMYMNQSYNQSIIEGHGDMIHSNIFVAEGRYNVSRRLILRAEAQYLATKQDKGDWLFGLVEASLGRHFMLTVSDQYNAGSTHEHYYNALLTSTFGSHRLAVGYGRTRAGFNCAGGVCRYVPATKGLSLSYNYNF